MSDEYKNKINFGVGIGLILTLSGKIMSSEYVVHNSILNIFGTIIGVMGVPVLIYGLSMYAKAKGRHWAWGFLGLLSLIGLIILYFLKDNNKDRN